jgi:uncharacterized protein (TIGR03086 family)
MAGFDGRLCPMNSTTTAADPRPYLAAALDQTVALLRGIKPEQLSLSTPCAEFDVQRLTEHFLGVLGRIAHVGAGGAPFEVPSFVEGATDPDAIWDAWQVARMRLEKVWSDDAVLDRQVQVPWGKVPGKLAALGYAQELLTHDWDVAVATGQRELLDDELAARSLAFAKERVPADPRGGPIPFAPVVEVSPGLDSYARLAGWLGRDPLPWI